ncbi:hypothetical protein VR45_36120 [Streptomyces sp. NRRL S-495]|nr:hypothetical protein VR45_36120 [Streptomyces sp. NRRL S-495]
MFVAARPDGEVLGCGGTIACLAAAGVRLPLVSVTDGEALHLCRRAPGLGCPPDAGPGRGAPRAPAAAFFVP